MKGKLLQVNDLKSMEGKIVWDEKYKKAVELRKVTEDTVDPTDFDSWDEYEKHKGQTYFSFWFDSGFVSDGAIENHEQNRFYEWVF